mmetsp:Transcript_135996/g.379030  ORF Transcript_135996/g.379030 Transcript_135996/m.379030 type:complete len:226 (+) Transcript_135996:202-879(+)
MPAPEAEDEGRPDGALARAGSCTGVDGTLMGLPPKTLILPVLSWNDPDSAVWCVGVASSVGMWMSYWIAICLCSLLLENSGSLLRDSPAKAQALWFSFSARSTTPFSARSRSLANCSAIPSNCSARRTTRLSALSWSLANCSARPFFLMAKATMSMLAFKLLAAKPSASPFCSTASFTILSLDFSGSAAYSRHMPSFWTAWRTTSKSCRSFLEACCSKWGSIVTL